MKNVNRLFHRILIMFFCFYLLFFYSNNIYANELNQENTLISTKIAFTSYLDGDSDIYIINPDGTGLINLTDDEYYNFLPSWSPDGKKIAYTSQADGNIYLIDLDKKNKINLTNSSTYDLCPDFSPGGSKIIYMSSTNSNNEFNIFLINTDGSNPVQLTDDNFINAYPRWSPDGKEIAFISNKNGSYDLFIMNADGSNVRYLVSLTARGDLEIIEALSISWSPDGSKIVFSSDYQGNFDIFTINKDGSNLRNITNTDNNEEALADWSPDGIYITFISIDENGREQIYIMNKDGSGREKVTNYQFNSGNPAWSPFF
jgi:Tol biopolymer transport system component